MRFENNTVINAAKTGQSVFRAAANDYKTQPRNILLNNNALALAASSTRPMLHLNNYAGAIVSDLNTWFSPSGTYGFWRDSTSGPNSYFTSLDQWRGAMNADARSRTIDPRLDAADLYRPIPGSLAVYAGETLAGVTSDYSGAPRPRGSATDIGAHEGMAVLPPTPTGLRVVKG